jgi:diguanylate cyclase (GGDEF)-like protein
MLTLAITLVVVGVVQYVAADRALTQRALAQLTTAHEADAKVLRTLYEQTTGHDRLVEVRPLLNHIATRPGVLRVALVDAHGVVAAVGRPGHGAMSNDMTPSPAGTVPAMSGHAGRDPHTGASAPAPSGHATSGPQTEASAPATHATAPGRTVGERVDDPSAAVVRTVTARLTPNTRLGHKGLDATVTVPVTVDGAAFAVEVVRSTVELRQQLSDLRRMLLGTLAVGLPFGLLAFYLLGAHGFSSRLDRALEDSATDALTGLRNHRQFHEELHRRMELARRHGRPLSVAVIDLDGFKQVNDSQGHRAGDRVLASVGLVLRQGRPEDLPFRIGGDEFALLLPETDIEGAEVAAEVLRQRVQADIGGVTTSIGLATYAVDAPDAETLLSVADAALYQAKHQGRNRVVRAGAVTASVAAVSA